jgi:hypothetical protein
MSTGQSRAAHSFASSRRNGGWGLPKGHVEAGETPKKGCRAGSVDLRAADNCYHERIKTGKVSNTEVVLPVRGFVEQRDGWLRRQTARLGGCYESLRHLAFKICFLEIARGFPPISGKPSPSAIDR